MDWTRVQGGTIESRLPIYAAGFEPDAALIVVRAAITREDMFHCSVLLEDTCVLRGCWNSPHREGGVAFTDATHGHTYNAGRREKFIAEPPLKSIEDIASTLHWARREALQSFLDWANIGFDGLVWTDPDGDGGERR
jgi:hypothetical protein